MKQVHETPPPPRQFEPDLPQRIERAILKCIEKNPAQRFQSVDELEASLIEKQVSTVAPPAALDAVPLPDHLARWQRSDWLLVGLALVGMGVFYSFFEQTNLVSRSKVYFDRSMLRLKAREYAQRFGASPGREREIVVWSREGLYDYLAQRVGAPAALEMINNPVPAWVWRVRWENDAWLHLDNQGSLLGFDLPRKSPSSGATEGLPTEEARPFAERALREIFHRDPAFLLEETAVRRPNGTGFGWAERNHYHGLKKRYWVFVAGREIQYLDQWFELPAGYALPNFPAQTLPLVATGFLIAVLGFLQRKQADPVAGWRAAAAIVGFILGGWVGWINLPGDLRIIFSLFSGVAFALLVFFMAVAIERSVARTAPAKLVNLVRLLDRKAAPEPRGIAVLRGTLLGLALLGADTFLIWLGTNHFAMRLDVFKHVSGQAGPFLGSPWPSLLLVLFVLLHVLFVTPPVIFMASFVGRFVRRAAVALLLAATLVAASVAGAPVSLAAVQPYPWKAVLFLIEGLLLVWVYHRFDVLTLHWAVLTFAFWWQNYRQLVMFEPTGAVEQWVAFAVWGTLVLAAAALAFQSSLRVAFRRAVSAFE